MYIYLVDVKNAQSVFFPFSARTFFFRFLLRFLPVFFFRFLCVFFPFSMRFLLWPARPGGCPAEISWREARILEYGPVAAKAVQEQIPKAKC